ncbi:tumor necrosis factor receptor superfamily member 21 isoform X1 [Takifugu flavidus]|uniref:Tumor necrosis factor receptor superfamily member 21 n=1 Tax=Takifugu flavidus TaxID=433684 RepID=A0A5C6NMY0_9TELE|nr:tumor necrosis factor receptor superfamily member 21 isoform X1 [Takifugu flavidus]TWW68285.1 Tumor necrosis factor receptor superfamily member 21 [Takifugu flavidus]
MSAVCVRAVLLCMLLVQVSVRVLTTGSAAERPVLSPRQYQHVDADSGTQLVCDKCPAGTFVSVHCSLLVVRECSPCPNDTFTHGENGVEQCHRCRPPCPEGLVEKLPCTTTQDRTCVCPSNSFLSRDGGRKCQPHLLCPPGTRMKKRGSETEDVVCKPCSKGTFSAVESHSMKCQAHTNCQAQGLLLLSPGTRDRDNVCGPPSLSSVSTTTPLVPMQGVHTPDPLISSHLLSSLIGPAPQGTYSQSVSIQLSGNPDGEDLPGEVLLLNSLDMLTTPRPTQKQLPENQQGQQGSDLLPDPRKRTMDHLEDAETVKTSNNKLAGQDSVSSYYRPTRRGSPRPSTHNNFDINEHLPWMIVLLLLLVLVVIVVCSVKRSSRVLKKGPMQDPSSIMEKAIQKKPSAPPAQVKEKWIYYSNGQGVDILKLVAAQVGTQWIDVYQSLANVTEREVAAFSNGYSSDHERAYAALQHWTIRDSDANLAKLINALHRQRRIDVVEKIRCVMEDNPQLDISQLMMTSVNGSQSLSPIHRPMESPGGGGGGGSGGGGSSSGVGGPGGAAVEQSPVDRTKGFFPDESEPLLRCDSTSSKDSALSRNGSFITKEKKDTVLRQVRLDPCDLQPIFDDMLHILNPEELHVIEEIPAAEDKLDRLFEIAGVKSQEASQTLLDSVYSHLPDLL